VALNVQGTNWLYQYKIHCYSGFRLFLIINMTNYTREVIVYVYELSPFIIMYFAGLYFKDERFYLG
jgi:hypothetical protein